MVERQRPSLSVVRQCRALGISRSSLYYQPVGVSQEGLELMKLLEGQYLERPFFGSRRMAIWLRGQGYRINRKRVGRLMGEMGLRAIYRRPRTSKPGLGHRVYPYLLRSMRITRPNQVWAADITYVPMARGFMYLVAIMDWHSRYVLAWRLSNTLDIDFCVKALEEALEKGKPEIFNTDQGSQFTSEAFTGLLKQRGIQISMDGKGSYRDNLFVERLWRSAQVRGGVSEGIRRRQGCEGRNRRVSQVLQHPETSPGLGLSNPGGGIHIWKWRKRGNITDDINININTGV